jgi:hypothetical protein
MSRWFSALLCGFLSVSAARGANPPPTQLFYVPFPEDQQLAGFSGVNTAAVDPLAVFVTFSAATDNTVIYYDHWEDGYERDITNPVQSTTLVFGDGNPANGYPPGNAGDLIPAGTVFSLRNYVESTTLQSVLDYDARDKVASYKPISLTKTSFPASTNTLLAGCVEVFEQGLWGTEYRVPVGEDMPTTTATATLTTDADIFAYTSLSIMAGQRGATVQIDKDNNGSFETTVTLAEGQTTYVTAVSTGGRVVSDYPVQVVLFSGRPGSNYQSRDTSLLPTYRWSNTYYAPVSTADSSGTTSSTDGTSVFLYNPGTSAITVSYDYRSSASAYTTATVNVPAGGNARVNLAPASGTTHFGAYKFYTTGATPPAFYAMTAVDSTSATTTNNQAYDGGFTLVGRPSLTTQVLVSLGIGRDPYSATNPTENGNPVWITTVGNNHTPATVYVDYNGDNAGPLADPNGNRYDVAYSLRELQQQKIFDPDGDQSGMLVYTLDSTVKIAAAWAQDPTVATAAQPGLDVSTLLPPLREGEGGKRSSVAVDADLDGYLSAGDTLEYDIRGINSARSAIPGPFAVTDNLPGDVVYVPGTTRYRFRVGGAWQAWVSIPDNGSGTAFPLDGSGFSVPGSLAVGGEVQVTFRATVKNYGSLSGLAITNSGTVEISPYGLLLPIEWSDVVYGSIGDRVWHDPDGDGVQDAGETGIPNIDVFADLNNNGVRDAGEPWSTTNSNGDYLLAGLIAGTYTVRVDPSDIAAANVGYGPTYDLDGISSSHVAVVTLNSAQDRVDADFGYRVGASVGDRVWMDRDGDGVQESGEPGINGIRVYLDLDNDNLYDVGEPNTITSGDGTYYIGNLNAGTYTVRVDTTGLPAGATQTFDLNGGLDHEASVTLIAAEHRGDLDFGYRGSLSIGDLVWDDPDADGTRVTYNVIDGRIDINNSASVDGSDDGTLAGFQIINGRVDLSGNGSIGTEDDGTFQGITVIDGNLDTNGSGTISNTDDLAAGVASEAGLANVRVYIDQNGNGQFDAGEIEATTNARGIYAITNLFNITYSVRVDPSTLPASYVQTYDLTAPSNDHAATVVMGGASRTDVDFAYRNDASLGDLVWNDRDADGVRDAGEPGIEGVIVYIDADDDNIFDQGIERFAITDVNGLYQIGNLPAGTYIVRVEFSTLPQGSAQTYDLDGVASLHEASRTLATSENALNVDFGYRSNAAVGDFVWNDLDADGVQDAGESGINGVRVYLDINGNGSFDSATEPSAITNTSGAYSITNLMPGNFTARVDVSTLPAGFVQTYDAVGFLDDAATFFVSANQTRSDIDFGYTQRASIGNLVWNDLDADGVQDAGEAGIPGVSVTLFNAANDTIAATTATNASGIYSITDIMPGTYYLWFDTPAGYQPTIADQGVDTADSDPSAITGRTANFTLTGGQTNNTLDAGYFQPATIGDFVFNDTNANGQQDGGETGLNGVTVTLFRPGFGADGIAGNADDALAVATITTAGGGAYQFSGLRPGTYQVNFGALAGYSRTIADNGADATDSDANPSTGQTGNIVMAAGGTNNTIDAGYYVPGTVFGHLYIDTNGDGDQDPGEPDLPNVNVTVTDVNGLLQTVVTDSNGDWTATVPPGSTTANVDESDPQYPAGYTQTEGTDPTTVTAVSGSAVDAGNDGWFLPGSISGFVLADTDNDGDGDIPLDNVLVRLLDSLGNPVLDGFGQPVTTLTLANGSYSFGGLPPADYCVVQDQPSNYASVSDTDGPNDNIIGNVTPITVTAGQDSGGNDFVETQFGSINGYVRSDDDNNGSGDTGLGGVVLNLLDSSGNPVLDGFGAPIQVATNASGFYQFTLVPAGSYRVSQNQPPGYASVSDVDGANNNLIGDETPIVIVPGLAVANRDFVEIAYGAISGRVFKDTNNDGIGDTVFPGVTVALLDGSGDPVDGDPNTPGVQPWTLVTGVDGSYRFPGLLPGNYRVSETQPAGYGSVSDVDGGNPDLIGNITPITVNPGEEVIERDFVEIELGVISGYVFVGSTPLGGVTLTLLDENGDPVDGDPNMSGVQPITTVTNGSGFYQFTGVRPGIYQVGQTQPYGYDSFGDVDGGDIDIIGDVTPITLSPGQHSENNNFVETLDTCPDDWAHWKFLHPSEAPSGNPDQDSYDNFAEFAFAMPHDNGTGSPWLNHTAWIIRPSTLAPGTLEGVFIRHKGAPLNVTYTLQYAAAPGNPTVWQEIVFTPPMFSTSDNGDCTETVTIHDLETLTGLTGGKGTVRIRADLDDDGGNDEVNHTSFTESEGWTETPLALCCRTYNNPYQREAIFTGTVSAVSGQDIRFTGQSLDNLIAPGVSYYVEVVSGENEGHRFDVTASSGDGLTLANDPDIHASTAPFNTLAGAPPVSLAGDTVILRRHWTLAEMFPPSAFGATGAPTTADEVQLFVDGAWMLFWNYDDSGNHRWVRSGSGFADQGGTVIPPGWGSFFNNRTAVTSLLAYGEVRANDFRRPLDTGNNLVGGGYPIDQSAAGTNGRAMTLAAGFFGSRDFKTADTIFLWNKDANAAASGYATYFLLNGAPVFPGLLNWAKVGDNTAASRDAEILLLENRAVFVRSKNGLNSYTSPSPWVP